ncbi:hypothetical protein ASPWEDRAFT_172701 [Aspergillus wentii DTO 134E9]|uniref:Tubby C-terminal domain-containing protein n=1 Tax=Aspergillus wentii DTO 134E9 TaxID=1073089 RepID=A0A1L9RLV3_ASPWE|nr:uncharacterized protein ASPWEDRAFT_172701 [Aspergillus wentii DTO 134E9]KAI9929636.1 hypothetical protein MW887_001110 [Aspergillus wentii]OJJ35916.1 hypothetical protein ASPWEDRAFT_172701 [Aspergillus wentii DTO 134E9]
MLVRHRHLVARGTPVQPPPHPIAIRTEHIPKEKTLIYIRPKADPYSANDYTVKDDATDETLFTVTGKKYGNDSGREFRDSSGLPLFELRRSYRFPGWRTKINLPGDKEDLVEVKHRAMNGNFDLIFKNQAAVHSKADIDKIVKLEVHRTAPDPLLSFGAVVGDTKVVDVRESLESNKSIVHMYTQYGEPRPKRVMDVTVAEGFDMVLASLISVMAVDSACPVDRLET